MGSQKGWGGGHHQPELGHLEPQRSPRDRGIVPKAPGTLTCRESPHPHQSPNTPGLILQARGQVTILPEAQSC